MRLGFWFTMNVALFFTLSPLHAAEKFSRTYLENSERVYQQENQTQQTLTIAGMNVETSGSTFQTLKQQVGARDADGKLAIEENIESLQSTLNFPGGIMLQFDSSDPDKKADVIPQLEPLLDIFRIMLKNPVTTTVNTQNKIEKLTIANNAQEKLPQEFQSYFNPADLQKKREQEWLFLPDTEVNVGDTWERFIDTNFGSGQTMNFKTQYRYAGLQMKDGKPYHKFDIKYLGVTYAIDPNANPALQVKDSDLKIEKSTGTLLYDPQTGEFPLRESEVKITGKLTLVINGMELPSDLDLTIKEKTILQK